MSSKAGEPASLAFSNCSGQPLCGRILLHPHRQPVCEELGLRKILENRGNRGAGSGKYGGHFLASERQEAGDNTWIELRAARHN